MLRIFSKQRKNTITTKVGKYLLYAVGEIFLIVAGILIAMALNNWNSKRILEKETVTALNNFQQRFFGYRGQTYGYIYHKLAKEKELLNSFNQNKPFNKIEEKISIIDITKQEYLSEVFSDSFTDKAFDALFKQQSKDKEKYLATIEGINKYNRLAKEYIAQFNTLSNKNQQIILEKADVIYDDEDNYTVNEVFEFIKQNSHIRNNLKLQEKYLFKLMKIVDYQAASDLGLALIINKELVKDSKHSTKELLEAYQRTPLIKTSKEFSPNKGSKYTLFKEQICPINVFNFTKDTIIIKTETTTMHTQNFSHAVAVPDSSVVQIINHNTKDTTNYIAQCDGYLLYE